MTPWDIKAMLSSSDSGSNKKTVLRVKSTQKLPMALAEWRAKPRIRAKATAMPVAAERKFCTVRTSIWVK